MPGFSIRKEALFAELRRNLHERYGGGFTIVKELLQNADDAEARRVVLAVRSGWPDAINPLLQVPGLLAVNNGVFSGEHLDGIFMLGLSVKANDRGSIGRFGFGQKALFHLCDAFIVEARGHELSIDGRHVVNPFLDLEQDSPARRWEHITADDRARLAIECERLGFPERSLAMWIPFRRSDLRPIQGPHRLSSEIPNPERVAADCCDADALRRIISTLRHLREVVIEGATRAPLQITIDDGAQRLRGVKEELTPDRVFPIVGRSPTGWTFVGRERLCSDPIFEQLKEADHWPQTDDPKEGPIKVKGAAHGAVTVVYDPAGEPRLDLCFALFLPVGKIETLVGPTTPQDWTLPGAVHIVLHGYFFLNSGRTAIDGFDEDDSHRDEASRLRQDWNRAIRDRVTLPLLPSVMRALLDERMMDANALGAIVGALAQGRFVAQHRGAICAEEVLVRVLDPAGGAAWRCLLRETPLRPVPDSVLGARQRLAELFPALLSEADTQGWWLAVGPSMLTQADPTWSDREMADLIGTVPAKALFSEALVNLLTAFLRQPRALGDETGAALVALLRRALGAETTGNLASAASIAHLLEVAPRNCLFELPATVTNRSVIAALARAEAGVLPLRAEWLDERHQNARIPDQDLVSLLRALEPLVQAKGEASEQALTAAAALLGAARSSIGNLAETSPVARLKALRAQDVRTGATIPVSLEDLVTCSENGLLFTRPPGRPGELPALLARALPDSKPLVVEQPVTSLLRDGASTSLKVETPQPEAIIAPVLNARTFGEEPDRVALLNELFGGARAFHADARRAARALAIGDPDAADPSARLIRSNPRFAEVWPLLQRLTSGDGKTFWAPATLDLLERHWAAMGVDLLTTEELGRILLERRDHRAWSEVGEAERDPLLLSGVSAEVLRQLPIHTFEGGQRGPITQDAVLETPGCRVPANMRALVRLLVPSSREGVRSVQQGIAAPWTVERQIDVALEANAPALYRNEILAALAAGAELYEARRKRLRDTAWLDRPGGTVAPKDVLDLSPEVTRAARAVLGQSELTLCDELSPGIREHAGFTVLREGLLPDRAESLSLLGLMIEGKALAGFLAEPEGERIEDLRRLAEAGVDLALPGWALIATTLRDEAVRDLGVLKAFIDAFTPITPEHSDGERLAARHLDALAGVAAQGGSTGEAARRLYRTTFERVLDRRAWPDAARGAVLGNTRVPTRDGGWRPGREVIASGEGIASSHVLEPSYAALFARDREDRAAASASASVAHEGYSTVAAVDETDLDEASADGHRKALEPWRGHIPPDLVILYLGLVGRFPTMLKLAEDWAGSSATQSVEAQWRALDEKVRPGGAFTLRQEVAQRRFLVKLQHGQQVRAIALSGEQVEVLLGENSALLLGNGHKRGAWNGRVTVHRLSVAAGPTLATTAEAARDAFAKLITAVAEDCLGLFMDKQRAGLKELLEQAANVTQTTLADTREMLIDRLPGILDQMKPKPHSALGRAQRNYRDGEERFRRSNDLGARERAKRQLWEDMQSEEATEELRRHTRLSIEEVGYRPERVLFELFQNADDAYEQAGVSGGYPIEVERTADVIRLIHWGRPINDLGRDGGAGRGAGYDRDLLNMLVRNVSEKRSEDHVTGKFGLGFKSVHLIAREVRIASGFLSLRILGGLIPVDWPEGLDVAKPYRERGVPTVMELVVDEDGRDAADRAVSAFLNVLSWLPAVARRIRCVSYAGFKDERLASAEVKPLPGSGVDLMTGGAFRALRLDLGEGFSLFMPLGDDGVFRLEDEVPRLWCLAPLEENVKAGWLMDGPFAVDPGRTGLAGTEAEKETCFERLGDAIGRRLVALYDIAMSDWPAFAEALGLAAAARTQAGAERFWARVHSSFAQDPQDGVAQLLHRGGHGYATLAKERPVVPTGLPVPFEAAICADAARYRVSDALVHAPTLLAVSTWRTMQDLVGTLVSDETAEKLGGFGFECCRFGLMNLLRAELQALPDARVEPAQAHRFGAVIASEKLPHELSLRDADELRTMASEARFRARDGVWRTPKDLSTPSLDDLGLCAMAPDSALLDPAYEEDEAAQAFFKLARERSGYGPTPQLWAKWAQSATGQRQAAVIAFLLGPNGDRFAAAIQAARPGWLPRAQDELHRHPLAQHLSEEDRNKLVLRLWGYGTAVIGDLAGAAWSATPEPSPPVPRPEPASVLGRIFDWWECNRLKLRPRYAEGLYPTGFDPQVLRNASDMDDPEHRERWFTFLALAALVNSGRTQNQQHRGFLDRARREGWWAELAASQPPEDGRPWLARLDAWSDATLDLGDYRHWRRSLVDLYTVARWLPEYVEIVRRLPRIAQDRPISLRDIFTPSSSAIAAEMGIDAAPLARTLGIGANWLVRELLRFGIYDSRYTPHLGPYAFASTERVRNLLRELDLAIEEPFADHSRRIFDFVREQLGEDRAMFLGDLDLPLQIITTREHAGALRKCLAVEAVRGWPDDDEFDEPKDALQEYEDA
jgi:hypothetical protein